MYGILTGAQMQILFSFLNTLYIYIYISCNYRRYILCHRNIPSWAPALKRCLRQPSRQDTTATTSMSSVRLVVDKAAFGEGIRFQTFFGIQSKPWCIDHASSGYPHYICTDPLYNIYIYIRHIYIYLWVITYTYVHHLQELCVCIYIYMSYTYIYRLKVH